MRKAYRILIIIALYVAVLVLYIAFFLFQITNIPLFLVLTISSVTVLSTGTVYTVIQSRNEGIVKKKESIYKLPKKAGKKKTGDLIEDYYDSMPSINQYANSKESYEDLMISDEYIFSIISREELDKINLTDLSKMDKIYFIREMLYFEPKERKKLIDSMVKSRHIPEEDVQYHPPIRTIAVEDKIRVYIRSLIEPGEKTKSITIDPAELIMGIKERITILFDYEIDDFLLSSGGILLNDDKQVFDYDIVEEDEIALIPPRKKVRKE